MRTGRRPATAGTDKWRMTTLQILDHRSGHARAAQTWPAASGHLFCARGRLLGSAYDPQAVASEDLVQCPLPADTRACATATDLAQCTSVGVAYCLSGRDVRSLEVGHMSREGECRRSSTASLLISRITRLTQHTHSRPIPGLNVAYSLARLVLSTLGHADSHAD